MANNKLNLSLAAMAGRNASAKRKWNVKIPVIPPAENFPYAQRGCNPEKCKLDGCTDQLTIEDRQTIYKKFAACTPDEKYFIESLCLCRVPGKQDCTYSLPKNDTRVFVCLTNFANTLKLSKTAVGRIGNRITNGDIFLRNMTGRHENRPHTIPEDYKEAAVEHMYSYLRVNNHYSRGHVDEETIFLKPPLTIVQMYEDFLDLYEDDDEVDMRMSESYFRQIFHSKKIKIGIPLMDTCAICDTHQNQIDNNRRPGKVAKHRRLKEEHLKKVEEAQRELRSDHQKARDDPDKVALLMIDAQKTIYTPQLSCGNAYFGTKYATRNFCINNEATNDPTMYLWDQTTAGIGANEIGSCILKYVMDNFDPFQNNQERELIVWSDRCKAQNNNWFMLCLYAQLQYLKYFTSIQQKFLITGHSYNSCDSNFGLVEKRLRVDRVIYPPKFVSVLQAARPSDPFTVISMTQAMFYSLNNLCKYIKRPSKFKVSRHIAFQLDAKHPNLIISKKTHAENCVEEEHIISFYGKLVDMSEMPIITDTPAYPEGLIPIKDGLRANLVRLERFLPPRAKQWFREQLKIGQNVDKCGSDSESESESENESTDED